VIKRILLSVAMIFALGAAVATAVVALAFAAFAVLEVWLGRAGAAAVVALIFAVFAGVVALLIEMQVKGKKARLAPREPSMTEKLSELARERPLLAGGAALAAGLIALKNPQVVASIVSAVLATRAADKAGRNRR
jgi:hypothetical protein